MSLPKRNVVAWLLFEEEEFLRLRAQVWAYREYLCEGDETFGYGLGSAPSFDEIKTAVDYALPQAAPATSSSTTSLPLTRGELARLSWAIDALEPIDDWPPDERTKARWEKAEHILVETIDSAIQAVVGYDPPPINATGPAAPGARLEMPFTLNDLARLRALTCLDEYGNGEEDEIIALLRRALLGSLHGSESAHLPEALKSDLATLSVDLSRYDAQNRHACLIDDFARGLACGNAGYGAELAGQLRDESKRREWLRQHPYQTPPRVRRLLREGERWWAATSDARDTILTRLSALLDTHLGACPPLHEES